MAKKDLKDLVGSWAFLIGIVLALILGLWNGYQGAVMTSTWILVLLIIGLIVGFLNISGKETNQFLMSGAVLIIASALGQGVFNGLAGMVPTMLLSILNALLVVFVPATIIVAIKNAFHLAKN